MVEEEQFCTKCGKKVPVGAQYCQQCGEPVAGSSAEQQRQKMYQEYDEMVKEGRMTWIMFLLIIYAVPALIMAIWVLCDTSALANSIWTNADFQTWFQEHTDVTLDTIKTYISTMGYMILISAVCACVSTICVIKRNWWMIAVVTCFIAAIFCIGSIFGMLIGILVGWMIYSARDSFIDQKGVA